jgi:hypothetical protein
MIETPNTEARFKARLDLWMHANNLMWSRLQPLNYLQVAYFIVSGYLIESRANVNILIPTAVFAVAVFYQTMLLLLVVNERNDRDMQGEILVKKFGFDPTEYSEEGHEQKYGFNKNTHKKLWAVRLGFLMAIFGLWMFVDLAIFLYFFLLAP